MSAQPFYLLVVPSTFGVLILRLLRSDMEVLLYRIRSVLRCHLPALSMIVMLMACAPPPQPGVAGIYESWDDVITRWIGKSKEDLYYELGPPNLHTLQLTDRQTEMVWDMTIDRMPGQADDYGLLPLTRSQSCRLLFVADQEGIIRSGRRIGCV
jgi:hypothetical protein